MASKKPKKTRPKPGDVEYRFEIKAYTPETMPMVRLAEYLKELAAIVGEPSHVHLVGIAPGSTVPLVKIAYEAVPKVQERTNAVRRGSAPPERQAAFQRINRMLREDNGKASFRRGAHGPRLLFFPGIEQAEDTYSNIRQSGAIEGTLIRVGGSGDTIPVWLEAEGRVIAHCFANRQVAKELAKLMFEPVRVAGLGVWARDKEGEWSLTSFQVQTYEQMNSANTLSDAITKLRAVRMDLGDDPIGDVLRLRHGTDA